MKYFFNSKHFLNNNYHALFQKLHSYISRIKPFDNVKTYQEIINSIIKISKKHNISHKPSLTFLKEIKVINSHKPLTEQTPWGGVTIKKVDVDRNYIKKLLVISPFGVLGFEIHKLKLERLKVLEGACIVLYSNHKKPDWSEGKITVKIAEPGDKFKFLPNDEHGIISLTKCIIEEQSTNHLDDLIYIFKSSQPS